MDPSRSTRPFQMSMFPSQRFVRTQADSTRSPESTPYAGSQGLGSRFKNNRYDIQCTLEGIHSASRPKWSLEGPSSRFWGALYFRLSFSQPSKRRLKLKAARVRVSVLQPDSGIVEFYAPSNGIQGTELSRKDAKNWSVNPTVQAAGVNASLGSVGQNVESSRTKSWKFKSCIPSSSNSTPLPARNVEFQWTRGWKYDDSGDDRSFRSALLLHMDQSLNVILSVTVEVEPRSRWVSTMSSESKLSHPIQPRDIVLYPVFQELVRKLESSIAAENAAMSPPCKSLQRHEPTISTDRESNCFFRAVGSIGW